MARLAGLRARLDDGVRAAGGVVIGEDSAAAGDDRRGRAARGVERVAAGPVRPRRDRGVGGQRLLVGQDEGQRGARRDGGRARRRGGVPARQLRPGDRARPRSTPSSTEWRRIAERMRARGMIYLDYQATTPVAPEVAAAMRPWIEEKFANPHSAVAVGQRGGGGDRDRARPGRGRDRPRRGRFAFTCGRDRGAQLGDQGHVRAVASGASSSPSPPNMPPCSTPPNGSKGRGSRSCACRSARDGLVDLGEAAAAIDDRTALVAAMLVNNEIGVIQPVAELARLAHASGRADAVRRGPGVRPDGDPRRARPGRDFGAQDPRPQGRRRACGCATGVEPAPLLHGGGQEQGLRSGTLSPALVRRARRGGAAGGRAARGRCRACRASCTRIALAALGEGWTLNGSAEQRYRGNLNLRRDGLDGARLIADLRNIAFSLGSACASGSGRPSHVLRALGLSDREARSSIRLGFGRYTGEEELASACRRIADAARDQRMVRVTRVRFLRPDGELDREVEAAPGTVCSTSRRPMASRSRAAARARWPARPAT